jgi:hypothetical protein
LEPVPRYLLRDRDRIFGKEFVDQAKAMGTKQLLSAPRYPWHRAYIERLIESIRRECLDHIIVFNYLCAGRSLRTVPITITGALICRSVKTRHNADEHKLPTKVVSSRIREVGGLHHHCERRSE